MVGEEYILEDLQDEEIERQAERQADVHEDIYDDATTPGYEKKDDLYTLFWKVISLLDSSKTGNLDKTELGMLNISVRDCQRIALLADQLGHPGFANFFKAQAEIILATSSSKKGMLLDLFVSQKKLRSRELTAPPPQQEKPRRKGLFRRR
jgi:hypothetical protein